MAAPQSMVSLSAVINIKKNCEQTNASHLALKKTPISCPTSRKIVIAQPIANVVIFSIQLQILDYIKAQTVYSGLEPGTAGWQAQTNPLSYDCPLVHLAKFVLNVLIVVFRTVVSGIKYFHRYDEGKVWCALLYILGKCVELLLTIYDGHLRRQSRNQVFCNFRNVRIEWAIGKPCKRFNCGDH